MEFKLNELEEQKAEEFINLHEAKHGRSKSVDGARYTYEFTPSSIGTACWIRCNCNDKIDITDWSIF